MSIIHRSLIRRPGILLLLAALIVFSVIHFSKAGTQKEAAPAKEASLPKGEVYGDWGTLCETGADKQKKCFISQTQNMKDSGKQLLKISVGYIGPKGEPTLVALLPLGISIPAGSAFQIDESPQVNLAFQFCTSEGCAASVQLDKASLQEMMDGKAMRIGIVPTGDSKTMSINVSLKGFKEGFASLSH